MKSAISSSPVVLVCPRTLVFSSAQHRIRLTCIFIVKIIAPWRETPRGGELAGANAFFLPPPHPRTLVFSSAQHRIRLTCIFIVKIIAPWRETPRGGELAGEACLLLPPA